MGKKFSSTLLIGLTVGVVFIFIMVGCSDNGCPTGQTDCNGTCVDLTTDVNNCNACGNVCSFAHADASCSAGTCTMGDCDEGSFDANSDSSDGCEACGDVKTICGITESCNAGTCEQTEAVPTSWKITSLSTTGCIANPRHEDITGDDNGGIAAGRSGAYYNGDDYLAGFSYPDMTPDVVGSGQVPGIFSDLATGELYSLTVGSALFNDEDDCGNNNVDGFVKLNPADYTAVGTPTELSVPFDACPDGPYSGFAGMFAGIGVLVQYDGTTTREIDLSDGTVTDLGTTFTLTDFAASENWSIWGIAEKFGGETYLVFRCVNCTVDSIVRRSVSTDTDEVLLDLDALATETGGNPHDIATITMDPARSVWIYHGESTIGMLGVSIDEPDPEEVIGYCPMTLQYPVP